MATVNNPESPFSGGVSYANYSADQDDLDVLLASIEGMTDTALIAAAKVSQAAIDASIASGTEAALAAPADVYRITWYNRALVSRGLESQITTI